jgi:hypothetical protein
MMRRRLARQGFGGALLKEAPHGKPLGSNALEVELGGAGPRDDDEIDPVRHQIGGGAKALAAEALHAVSLHGAPDLAPDDEP